MTTVATARNATLLDLNALLVERQARKIDAVVPAAAVTFRDGLARLRGIEALVDETGVTDVNGTYRPTRIADEHLGQKLGIPVPYLRRLRDERPHLYDANVNAWLHGRQVRRGSQVETIHPADDRSFLLRMFRADAGGDGVLRGVLSDGYGLIDDFDVLTAALEGVQESGAEVGVDSCDLTERSMRVRIVAPGVAALAPVLLKDYRSPFDVEGVQRAGGGGGAVDLNSHVNRWRAAAQRQGLGYPVGHEPVVFAGFEISNSELGAGAFTLTPRLVVKICRNGLTVTADALRRVHLGSKLDDGVVAWSDTTRRKALELIKSKTTDAVRAFLSPEYVAGVVAEIERKAGARLTEPEKQIKILGKQLGLPKERTEQVLAHFIMGGSLTAGGLLNAVTSVAQTLDDGDAAAELEARGLDALNAAAALAR